ncbi:hypothetical protein LTR82_001418 [Friedmanniomyces endolithicus]|uniref:Heterokaryon incompatibility domain-containing protein n=1 Tax=Friedmanniomyces endolithicus TaxID=329885 RepID=A0AAN6JF60_9PEZI|nr:hypothetical protein LTR82_001418 [Friedmanniomyces endolithicus]
MPTYALLGATGSTGSAVLRYLLEIPPLDLTLNIFVRNEDKLLKAFPDLLSTKQPCIKIVKGVPSDQDALLKALENATVIFQCIATNESKPGVSVAYDTVYAVTGALDVLHNDQEEKYRTPFVVQVRAAPLNPMFAAQEPWLMSTFIHFALYHTYADTDRACKHLASMHDKTPALLDYAFVDTFAVFDGEGTTRTGHELTLTGPLPNAISYADVGAGFCEIAERREEFKGKGVGVRPTGKVKATPGLVYASALAMPAPIANLCDKCQNGFSGLLLDARLQECTHHASLSELGTASRGGCPPCRWLLSMFNERRKTDSEVEAAVCAAIDGRQALQVRCARHTDRSGWYRRVGNPDIKIDPRERDTAIIYLSFKHPILSDITSYNHFQLVEVESSQSSTDYTPASYTGARACLDLAHSWLNTCQASHDECKSRPLKPLAAPSRLLWVPPCGSDATNLAVREARLGEYQPGVPYISLSHRWGSPAQLLLKPTNRPALRLSIPVAGLKKSVQDAITLVQRFGVSYLWVDTLCILQDDPQDLAREIADMHNIYSNAVCNIAASDAEADDEGCFVNRDPALVTQYRVRLIVDPSGEARHLLHRGWQPASDSVDSSVLASRGWVFQERLLSRRLLHCTKQGLVWECFETEASEMFPEGQLEQLGHPHSRLKAALVKEEPSIHGSKLLNEDWPTIVQYYTVCNLTYSQDKLKALAGISAMIQEVTDDEYIAGFWKSRMLWSLCWVPMTLSPRRFPSAASPAPSWSWASVQGMIYPPGYISDRERLLVSMEGIRYVSAPPESKSLEKWPILDIQGHILDAEWEPFGPWDSSTPPTGRLFVSSKRADRQHEDMGTGQVSYDDSSKAPPRGIQLLPIYESDLSTTGLVLAALGSEDLHCEAVKHSVGRVVRQRIGTFQSSRLDLSTGSVASLTLV